MRKGSGCTAYHTSKMVVSPNPLQDCDCFGTPPPKNRMAASKTLKPSAPTTRAPHGSKKYASNTGVKRGPFSRCASLGSFEAYFHSFG